MAQELINIGVTADDGTGDTIRGAGIKINNNFTELFARSSVTGDFTLEGNNITLTSSNADIEIGAAGTGSVVFPAIKFNDNNIEGTRTNEDIKLVPNGSGKVVIGALNFSGTSITSDDSTAVNINENLNVDGTLSVQVPTLGGGLTINNTLDVSGATTLSTLSVSGASTFVGTVTIDNLTFNDNIIATSSNADLNLTPGGTGVVRVAELTLDSSINLKDNVLKVTRSNDDLVLSANGTGSVVLTNVDLNEGTVDNTVIGGSTPAAGTFSTLSMTDTTLTITGVTVTDNTVKASRSNDDLELTGNGTGSVAFNGIKFPTSDGSANQVLRTDGSGQLTYFTSPILFDNTDLTDGTATITADSSAQRIDSFDISVYRSANYLMQFTDATADRYSLIEANVTHDGSNAYISVFGGVDNGTGDGSTVYDSVEFTAVINSGNVRVRAKVNNSNDQVVKFVRRIVKI